MSASAGPEFDAAYWEHRYRSGEGSSRLDPSPSLVAEAAALPPGRALDAGCGVGADALWLAARGWHVTAVDVSRTAVEQGRRTAEAAGGPLAERTAWHAADLTTWTPGSAAFDLVSCHYVHVPGPLEVLVQRLASWVAPGGSLLVVGHGDAHGHGHGHGLAPPQAPPTSAQVRAEQLLACLPSEEWAVLAAEPRTHAVPAPDGSGLVRLHDVVVHARRRSAGVT